MSDSQNEKAVFRRLFDDYADSLYRYARYSLPSEIDPRDVVQEVFLRAFRSWHEFQGDSSPKTWLFRIARNHIYDLLRKKRQQRTHELDQVESDGAVSLDTLIELEDALTRLQPDHQQVLNLRLIQDMSVTDAATVLNWSESKVRVTFHRAKKKLREILQEKPDVLYGTQPEGGESAHGKR